MSTPQRLEGGDTLISMYGTIDYTSDAESLPSSGMTTAQDQGPGTDLEDIIQSIVDAYWAETYMHSWDPPANTVALGPMSLYQIALFREVEMLFGTSNQVVVAELPPNGITPGAEDQGSDALDSVRRMCSRFVIASLIHIGHYCLATVPCQWTEGGFEACGDDITCMSVAVHLGDRHGIRKLSEDTPVCCRWEGCRKRVKRKNFVRHFRECHLDHPREMKQSSANRAMRPMIDVQILRNGLR
ncbi:hypothetical protein OG21DRAFT_1511341, partial [Imleria badia]